MLLAMSLILTGFSDFRSDLACEDTQRIRVCTRHMGSLVWKSPRIRHFPGVFVACDLAPSLFPVIHEVGHFHLGGDALFTGVGRYIFWRGHGNLAIAVAQLGCAFRSVSFDFDQTSTRASAPA